MAAAALHGGRAKSSSGHYRKELGWSYFLLTRRAAMDPGPRSLEFSEGEECGEERSWRSQKSRSRSEEWAKKGAFHVSQELTSTVHKKANFWSLAAECTHGHKDGQPQGLVLKHRN